MKTKYKFIHFVECGVHPIQQNKPHRFNRWECYNNRTGDLLGTVKWYLDWNQYEYLGTEGSCFTAGCLRDIADFMDRLKELG